MSETTSTTAHESENKRGQKGALDNRKRQRIVGMLMMGSSRRAAAKAVGVHVSTIGRTMARDAAFDEEVTDAEIIARQRPLKSMFLAMENNWRAAAWMLERRCPDDFGRRKPKTYTHTQVREIVDQVLDEVLQHVAEESDREEISQTADRFVEALQNPPPAAPVNELLEMEKMEDEVQAHRQAKQEAELAQEDEQRKAVRDKVTERLYAKKNE